MGRIFGPWNVGIFMEYKGWPTWTHGVGFIDISGFITFRFVQGQNTRKTDLSRKYTCIMPEYKAVYSEDQLNDQQTMLLALQKRIRFHWASFTIENNTQYIYLLREKEEILSTSTFDRTSRPISTFRQNCLCFAVSMLRELQKLYL